MSAWDEYKKKLGTTRPWDLLDAKKEFASTELADSRYDACTACDKFISLTSQCSECLCFMKYKTKLAEAECPLHKW